MIKGETVTLIVKTQIDVDPFGEPILNSVETPVENVIVGSPTFDQAVSELNLSGKRIAFTLGIPKGDTHSWTDTEVIIRGKRYRTYGFPLTQTEANVPGSWNTQVKVEYYE